MTRRKYGYTIEDVELVKRCYATHTAAELAARIFGTPRAAVAIWRLAHVLGLSKWPSYPPAFVRLRADLAPERLLGARPDPGEGVTVQVTMICCGGPADGVEVTVELDGVDYDWPDYFQVEVRATGRRAGYTLRISEEPSWRGSEFCRRYDFCANY